MARRSPFSYIGVDLGRRSAELVQLKWADGSWELHEISRAEMPPEDDFAQCGEILRDAMRSSAFRGRKAATTLGIDDLDVRPLRLPAADPNELAEMVRFEIEGYLAYPIHEALIDYVNAGEVAERGQKKVEVIAVSTRRESVEKQVSILRKAGMRTQVVDMGPCALSRALGGAEKGAIAVLDLGMQCSVIGIVQDANLIFCRRVECGGKHITDAIAQKLDLSSERAEDIKVRHGLEIGPVSDIGDGDESDISRVIFDVARESLERIAREIEKSLGYCAANRRGLRVQKLLLAGGGSMMKNVDKFFADRLGIATEVGNPFKGIELGANPIAHRLARQAPLYTVAVGLAKLEAPGNGTH